LQANATRGVPGKVVHTQAATPETQNLTVDQLKVRGQGHQLGVRTMDTYWRASGFP
jgi:hypothetical protein